MSGKSGGGASPPSQTLMINIHIPTYIHPHKDAHQHIRKNNVLLTEESVYTEEIMFHHVHNAINAHRRSSRLDILVQNEYCRYRTKIVGHENEWVMSGFLGYWVPNSSDPGCVVLGM